MLRSKTADREPKPADKNEERERLRPAIPLHDPFGPFDFAPTDGGDFR